MKRSNKICCGLCRDGWYGMCDIGSLIDWCFDPLWWWRCWANVAPWVSVTEGTYWVPDKSKQNLPLPPFLFLLWTRTGAAAKERRMMTMMMNSFFIKKFKYRQLNCWCIIMYDIIIVRPILIYSNILMKKRSRLHYCCCGGDKLSDSNLAKHF